MEFVTALKARLPEYAKDIRLNLDAVISRSSLTPQHAVGAALAAAVAAGRGDIVDAIVREALLEPAHQQAALTAAALMGMNNVWYPFVEMAGDADLKSMRAELRMNAYANHGGVDRSSFELYALAASIVGKCEFCVQSHYRLLKENGFTVQQLRDVGRIAAVIQATANILALDTSRTASAAVAA